MIQLFHKIIISLTNLKEARYICIMFIIILIITEIIVIIIIAIIIVIIIIIIIIITIIIVIFIVFADATTGQIVMIMNEINICLLSDWRERICRSCEAAGS